MRRRRVGVILLAIVCLVNTTGCLASLSLSEERQWGRLLDKQVVREPIRFKSKGWAGFWSAVVPGIGHFYVGEEGLGVAYLLGNLLWPLNIFWTIPAGLQATAVTNKRRTVEYFTMGAHSKQVENLKAKGRVPADFKSRDEVTAVINATP